MPRDGTGIDVARLRADTPGCAGVLDLNNPRAALPPAPALDAVIRHLRREAEIGGCESADEAAERLQAVQASSARLIGAAPDEMVLVACATQAWALGFHAFDLQEGDLILTARAGYASNVISFLQLARARGVVVEVVEVVPSDADGTLDVEALARMIDARTKLMAVTHVPADGGLLNAAAIGAVARAHGVAFLLDACQPVGQLPIDVTAIGCDMLSAAGRKFLRGPRGSRFLHMRRALLDRLRPPSLDLHPARWTGPRGLTDLVRASPHADNTEDELDRFIDAGADPGGGTRDG